MSKRHKNIETFLFLQRANLINNPRKTNSYMEYLANKKENKSLTRESIRKGTKKIH